MDKKTVQVVSKCPTCRVVDKFEVPEAGLVARRRGVKLVDAFPTLSRERLVQLAEHTCPACQDKEVKR